MRALFLAGERCDPDTLTWAENKIHVPVIDHWWQTETGWAIAANCLGLEAFPVKAGSPTKPVPGYDVQFLDESGKLLQTVKWAPLPLNYHYRQAPLQHYGKMKSDSLAHIWKPSRLLRNRRCWLSR
ncbi:AMP-binding protein [Cycloclasticus sp. PY97N]|uniref:AMP-binding protein n=1 Tax=Cycloclasticus sp. PY97N TaxID=728003 RepID=UPI000BC311EE|nr:AMP-binding protein [Cycloclasticus sp. PY97N]